jgi:hypothetical protein
MTVRREIASNALERRAARSGEGGGLALQALDDGANLAVAWRQLD